MVRKKQKKKIQQSLDYHNSFSHQWHRQRNIKKMYDLSWEDYLFLYESQKGCCAICDKFLFPFKLNLETKKTDVLYMNHDHYTGIVRGLLCNLCNDLLGRAQDKIKILNSAIDYLKKNKEIE